MSEEVNSVSRPVPNADFGVELVRDWEPESSPTAIVVLVHGLAEHSGRYARTGSLLARAGFHVRSFDLRGAGASGGRRWDIEDWSLYLDQIERHVDWAATRGAPIVLMGHSMGGTLVIDYAGSDRRSPHMLVLSAPGISGGARWQRAVAPLLARMVPTLPVPNRLKGEQLSRDPAVGEAYFADPLVHTSSTPRLGAQLFDAIARARATAEILDLPTLVLHGGSDTIIAPGSTAFLGDLHGVERRLYPGLRHEILNEPEGPQVVADIVEWIDSRL